MIAISTSEMGSLAGKRKAYAQTHLARCRGWSPDTEPLPARLLWSELNRLFCDAMTLLPDADWSILIGQRLLGWGNQRAGFIDPVDPRFIIKIPRNQNGISDNELEVDLVDCHHPDIPTARMDWALGQWAQFRAIRCERVKLVFPEPRIRWTDEKVLEAYDMPAWTYEVDAGQVGYTSDGRLVAFDLGR